MLIPLNNSTPCDIPSVTIGEASFPQPFAGTLEYNAPIRGTWNIVHVGMLVPESHQVYVCAAGCLRGVIQTAAEMCAMDRMSWVAVNEEDMFNGQLEENIITGTEEILARLPKPPRAILLFISCIHQFAGCDMQRVIHELTQRHSETAFVDCYMTPTMRKSGLTPDQLTRRQIYTLLPKTAPGPKTVSIIGNDRPTSPESELLKLFAQAGWQVRDITLCHSYDEFLATADSSLYVTTFLPAKAAAEALALRTQRPHLHLPLSYTRTEITAQLTQLSTHLGIMPNSYDAEWNECSDALSQLREELGARPIAIDYTATPRPLGLARLLVEHHFNVACVYADAFSPEERDDFAALKVIAPQLLLRPTVHPAMLYAHANTPNPQILAIGQKAAWFSNTPHFVNIVSGGGMWGFAGIKQLVTLMREVANTARDTDKIIQHKGIGCTSCLMM
jgi:hypothetical protein